MRSWLVALRIARREALRAKGRTALIVTMIALPVMALSFAAATYDMYELTPQESVTREMGAADAIVNWVQSEPISQMPDGSAPGTPATTLIPSEASLRTLLPAGTSLSPFWSGIVSMRTAAGIGALDSFGIDMNVAATKGLAHILSGRAPRADGEVVASPQALTRLGAKIGSTITTVGNSSRDFPARAYTVVGTVRVDSDLGQTLVFMPSQQAGVSTWLVSGAGPVGVDDEKMLNSYGIEVESRALLLNPPPNLLRPDVSHTTIAGLDVFGVGTLIGGLGLLEVVLLAGPAFTVGARRRQRDLALVATTGGSPSVLRRIVLADGVVGGLAAATIGLLLGLAAAVATRPILEQHLSHSAFGAYRVSPLAVVAIAGLAVLTGVLGALVPAFAASRQDVVAALTGRRGVTRSRLGWLLLGAAGVAAASVITFAGAERHNSNIVLLGLVTGELGLVLCTPTIVGVVARLGRFLPVAPRVALRDTARRRAASAPAISAVMAAVAGSVALTVYLGASDHRSMPYEPTLPVGSLYINAYGTVPERTAQLPKIDAAAARVLPSASMVTVDAYDSDATQLVAHMPVVRQCPYTEGSLSSADMKKAIADTRCAESQISQYTNQLSPFVTTNPAVLHATLGLTGTPLADATAMLVRGGVVVTDARLVVNGEVTLQTWDDKTGNKIKTGTFPAIAVPTSLAPAVIVSPPVLPALALTPRPFGVVVTPTRRLTQAQSDALSAALAEADLNGPFIENGAPVDDQTIAIILALAAGVIALGAAAIATGLAAVDGRGDLTTLGAVGATPRMRRVLALSQSGTIAGLGSLLGAAAGFGAGAAVLFGINQVYAGKWPAPHPYPIEVPWLNLGVSLVLVPVVAMLGAGLLTRSRLPSERRAE